MNSEYDDLKDMIALISRKEIKCAVPRLGQVLKVQDDEQKGRILVSIPSFGWTTQDTAEWCYPKDRRRLITPKIDDWVIVEWIDGNVDKSAVYSGIAYWMKDMLPKNYDGQPTTQLLYEDNDQELSINYDEKNKILKVNYEKDDNTISSVMDFQNKKIENICNDVSSLLDGQNKKIRLDDSVNYYESDGNAGTVKIENQAGNTFEQGASSTKINGTNLEVLL